MTSIRSQGHFMTSLRVFSPQEQDHKLLSTCCIHNYHYYHRHALGCSLPKKRGTTDNSRCLLQLCGSKCFLNTVYNTIYTYEYRGYQLTKYIHTKTLNCAASPCARVCASDNNKRDLRRKSPYKITGTMCGRTVRRQRYCKNT